MTDVTQVLSAIEQGDPLAAVTVAAGLRRKLEATPERPSAELPESKIPAGKRRGQFVEVTGAQRPQEHEPFPAVTFNRRQVAVFRLDCAASRDSLEELEQKRPRSTTPLKPLPVGSPP
jgi:hypothetical protein